MSRKRIVGASILPITRDPVFNNIYFVLGRERRYPQWRESETWGDFGGGVRYDSATDQPESAEICAAREAWEETACILRFKNAHIDGDSESIVRYRSYHPILDALQRHQYIMRVCITQPDGAQYICFVIETPFEPWLPLTFARLTRALRVKRDFNLYSPDCPADHPAIQDGRVNAAFIEKTSLGLFSLPTMRRALGDGLVLTRSFSRSESLRNTFALRLKIVLKHMGCVDMRPSIGLSGITWAIGETPSDEATKKTSGLNS